MKILWSDQATAVFWSIRDRLFDSFGIEAENNYLDEVDEALKQVTKFPKTGVPEYELSADGSVRSILVHGRSRIVYYVEDDVLYVADVWELRQDPNALLSRFEK